MSIFLFFFLVIYVEFSCLLVFSDFFVASEDDMFKGGGASFSFQLPCLNVKLRQATFVYGWVYMLPDEPAYRPFDQWIGYSLLYDRVHGRKWSRPSLETLWYDVVGRSASVELDHDRFIEPDGRRSNFIWWGTINEVKTVDEDFLDSSLDFCLSAVRVNEINFHCNQALDFAFSDFPTVIRTSALLP